MGPLGELGALFNPGMRHEIEEQLSKQMLREEEGTGRKGRLGIDLDSGVVVMGDIADPPAEDDSDDDQATVAPAGDKETHDAVSDQAQTKATSDSGDPALVPASRPTPAVLPPEPKVARSTDSTLVPQGKRQRQR